MHSAKSRERSATRTGLRPACLVAVILAAIAAGCGGSAEDPSRSTAAPPGRAGETSGETGRAIRLLEPQDSSRAIWRWQARCGGHAGHPSPVPIAWQPLEEGLEYRWEVSAWKWPPGGKFTSLGSRWRGVTEGTSLSLDLPPSGTDECYLLEISAWRGAERLPAGLRTGGFWGGLGWDYRFRVLPAPEGESPAAGPRPPSPWPDATLVASLSFEGGLEGFGVLPSGSLPPGISFTGGVRGLALEVDGGVEVVETDPSGTGGSWTLLLWARLPDPPAEEGQAFFRCPLAHIAEDRVVLPFDNAGGHMQLPLSLGDHRFRRGRWHRLAVSLDHGSRRAAAYLDGQLTGEARYPGSLSRQVDVVRFGRPEGGPAFRGLFDEWVVVGRVLTPAEIAADAGWEGYPSP